MQRVQRELVTIGGACLEYAWLGPAPARAATLVMLHEGLGCVAMWKDFPAALAAATGCGVLAYSRAGYGGSDPVAVPRRLTYMHDEALTTLPRLLDAFAIKRAVMVGHSDGASIALIHAGGVRDPRVQALALLAPHVFNEPVSVASIRAARDAYEHGDLRPRLARYHGTNVDCAFWGWNRAWLDPGFLTWNIEEYLCAIRVPILLLQGQDDEYGTARQLQSIQTNTPAPVQTEMPANCGHAPHRDQPAITLNAITEFVARTLAPAPPE